MSFRVVTREQELVRATAAEAFDALAELVEHEHPNGADLLAATPDALGLLRANASALLRGDWTGAADDAELGYDLARQVLDLFGDVAEGDV